MTIAHHGVKKITTLTCNAQVVNRSYLYNEALNRWDPIYFKLEPNYTDVNDPIPVLPTTPNGGWAFYDSQYIYTYPAVSGGITLSMSNDSGTWLNVSQYNNLYWMVSGSPVNNVPNTSGTHIVTCTLSATNPVGEIASQQFTITLIRN